MKMENKHHIPTIVLYTTIGVLFGMCFPIGAIILESILQEQSLSISAIMTFHQNNQLLFMIDSAPLFLGVFAMIGGFSRSKAVMMVVKMENMIQILKEKEDESQQLLSRYKVEHEQNQLLVRQIKSTSTGLLDNSKKLMRTLETLRTSDNQVEENMVSVDSSISFLNQVTQALIHQLGVYGGLVDEIFDVTQSTDTLLKKHLDDTEHIGQRIDTTSTVLNGLQERSIEVNRIGGIIFDISEKIKILSLNASIEAQRAGAVGRGFAVIANEVQKLSSSTTVAAGQIKDTIDKVTGGIVDLFSQMKNIKEISDELNDHNDQVRMAFEHVASQIMQIQSITHQSEELIEKEDSAIKSISEQIQKATHLIQNRNNAMDENEHAVLENEEKILLLKEQTGIMNVG